MKVCVLVITYNQEKYIAQAIDSVLMQEVGFAYEIVIGEDASTDRTREIVLELQRKHPERIRVMLREAVDAERDRARGLGGKTNFVQTLQACRGEYVALLDGDDYWTDPHKLQKQVDFLDQHPDFAISFHNAAIVYENGSKGAANYVLPDQPEFLSLEDLLFTNVIPTCSAVFRRGLFGELPDWFFSLNIGDWPLHIMNAQYGKVGYINEIMAAYRVHQKGLWSSRNAISQRLALIKMLDHVDAYLGFKYKKQVRAAKAEWYYKLASICYVQGDRPNSRIFLRKHLLLRGLKDAKKLVSLFLRLEAPTFYTRLRTLRTLLGSPTGRMISGRLFINRKGLSTPKRPGNGQ